MTPEQIAAFSDIAAADAAEYLGQLSATGLIAGNNIEGYSLTRDGDLRWLLLWLESRGA